MQTKRRCARNKQMHACPVSSKGLLTSYLLLLNLSRASSSILHVRRHSRQWRVPPCQCSRCRRDTRCLRSRCRRATFRAHRATCKARMACWKGSSRPTRLTQHRHRQRCRHQRQRRRLPSAMRSTPSLLRYRVLCRLLGSLVSVRTPGLATECGC